MPQYHPRFVVVSVTQLSQSYHNRYKIGINRPKLAKMSRNWINLRHA